MKRNTSHRLNSDRRHFVEALEERRLLSVTPVAADWLIDLPPYPAVDFVVDTAADSSGNLFALGRFQGTVDFDPGSGVKSLSSSSNSDWFLAKYDSSSALLEAVDLGDIPLYNNVSLAIDGNGDVYVAGDYWGDATFMNGQVLSSPDGPATFVVKLDNNLSNIAWATQAMLQGYGPYSYGEVVIGEVAVDSAGTSVYVAGQMVGQGTIGTFDLQVNFESFVWRMDATNGTFQWIKVLPNTGETAAVSVDPIDSNSIFVHLPHPSLSDRRTFRFDANGNQIWEKTFPVAWSDFAAYDGGLYVTGTFSDSLSLGPISLDSAGGSDAFMARLDASTGAVTWAKSAGGPGYDTGDSIGVDPISGAFVFGTLDEVGVFGADTLAASTPSDMFLSQIDPLDGHFVQSWRFGRAYKTSTLTADLAVSAGSVYVGGKYGPGGADFPNGFASQSTPDDRYGRYLMRFAPTSDPSIPRINGFVASPDPAERGNPLSLSVSGMFDPATRVNNVVFYHDIDGDRLLNPAIDTLLGTDGDGSDGWGIEVATSGLPLGETQFLAQATYDGNSPSLVAVAETFLRNMSTTYVSSNVGLQIRDLKTVTSTLNVADSLAIGDVDVTLNITHTANEDLDVFLIHPDGTRIELFTDVGFSSDNFVDTTLDDQADDAINDVPWTRAPYTGRYRPEGLLNMLNGKNSAGVWKLEITDDSRHDQGTLNAWSLTLAPLTALPPTLSIDDVQVTEGDAGTTVAQFAVTRSGDTSQSVSVDVATADGTATAGSDYVAIPPTTLTFAPGVMSLPVSIVINGDTDLESDETFLVELSNPVGATLTDAQGVATILDDDGSVSGGFLYVYDIRFESKRGGKDWRAVFEIRNDSDADGVGEASDAVAAGVEVTVTFAGQTYTGTTDANGVFRTSWRNNLASGDYYANAVDLALAGYSWNPFDILNLEDDSDGDGKPDDLLSL